MIDINNSTVKQKDIFDWEFITSPVVLAEISKICQRNVCWKTNVLRFVENRVYKSVELSCELRNGTYKKNKPRHIVLNERGKERVISPVVFRDRIVQRSLCEFCLLPLIVPTLIYDNTASIKGKGTMFSRNRFLHHYRSALNVFGKSCYFVKIDYRDYFHSIDNDLCWEILEKVFWKRARDLPVEGRSFKEIARDVKKILSLLKQFVFEERGLGLGNQTSQILAIWYCNEIDHYIKEKIKIKRYGRYMDDSYAFVKNKEEGIKIISYVREESKKLGLELNEKKTRLYKLTEPIVWLKDVYLIKNNRICTYLKSDVFRRFVKHYKAVYRRYGYDDANASLTSFLSCKNRVSNSNKFEEFVREKVAV